MQTNYSSRKTGCFVLSALVSAFVFAGAYSPCAGAENTLVANAQPSSSTILQRIKTIPFKLPDGRFYIPATLSTMRWGYLPNRDSKPILSVPSGSELLVDTLSSEGMVDDQGRNPVKFFGKFGVRPSDVLEDAIEICASKAEHNMVTDGPHIIIGPVAIEGAQPGDVLKVDMISFVPRVPYGIVGNRHGKGVLPEYPQNDGPKSGASSEHPDLYGSVFTFVPIKDIDGKLHGVMHTADGKDVCFPLGPFIGTMGVAPDTSAKVNSIPPSSYGGNLDLKDLTVGASLYLPIELPQGMFFIGDPHFTQGDGEVSLTAVEGSLRATIRLTLLKAGDPAIPGKGPFKDPFAETSDSWIPIGLDPDLNEATKKAVRNAIKFLVDEMEMDNATAYNYLSAAANFHITQAVDITKGVHGHISKKDFAGIGHLKAK
ncbi:MAG TPA: acetamidase/formamidase family protein [Oculatellaceae cyanobacterium]